MNGRKRPDAAPPKEVQTCGYNSGRHDESGDPCTREANHEGGCFAPITPDTFEHPSDCHCQWCSAPPSDAGKLNIVDMGYDEQVRRGMIVSQAPPSDAAPVEWWHWVDDNGDDRFVRGDKFPNFDATALYAHPEDAPEPSAPRCPQCNDTGVRVLPVPGFPDECPCGGHPEDAPGGPTRVIPNDEIVGRGWA